MLHQPFPLAEDDRLVDGSDDDVRIDVADHQEIEIHLSALENWRKETTNDNGIAEQQVGVPLTLFAGLNLEGVHRADVVESGGGWCRPVVGERARVGHDCSIGPGDATPPRALTPRPGA